MAEQPEHDYTSLRHSAEHGFAFRGRSAEHGSAFCRRFAEHGFTLIEIMVALAVFSLAAMALIRLEGATIRGAATLDASAGAQLVARNVAIEAVTDAQAPALGRSDGRTSNGGRGWTWTRIVSGTGDPRIVRIDVAVAGSGRQVLGRSTMIRAAAVAAP